jgi:FkbM family methyltransferase
MGSGLDKPAKALRSSMKAVVLRAGREEQARAVLGRVREVRAAFDSSARRTLRDDHAMRVVLATALRSTSNAIDVGANEGELLELITAIAPAGRHIAYEPVPVLHAALAARFPSVEVRGRALSDEAGMFEFAHVVDLPTRSGLLVRTDLPPGAGRVERISVAVERLDDALEDTYVPSLIKIDVEGAELNVMRGAASTLERHRPFVLFEHGIGGADLYGAGSGDLFDLLKDSGLRIFDLDGDGPYSRGRFESMFTQPLWNYLAAPA